MIVNGHKEFTERLEYICGKYADKPAITYMRDDDSKECYTFGDLFRIITQGAECFAKFGLYPGDRVAIISPHSPYAVMSSVALAYANITSVLIDAALPMEEIVRLLAFSDVRAVFTISDIFNELPALSIEDMPCFDLEQITNCYTVFSESVSIATCKPTSDPYRDTIAILFSSGTTTTMKGVMITYHAIITGLSMWLTNIPFESNDMLKYFYVLPFNHLAGYATFMENFLYQVHFGFVENINAIKMQKGLLEFNADFFIMIPKVYEVMAQKIKQAVNEKGAVAKAIFYGMLKCSGFIRKRFGINIGKILFKGVTKQVFGNKMSLLLTGASQCATSISEFYLNLGFVWGDYYACTETYLPTVASGSLDHYPTGTVGKVNRFDDVKAKIDEPDDSGVGEVRIKTILIMKGYFRDPEATAAAFDEDGYFKTGDLGYIDKKGYLHITGRIKEAIHMQTGKKVAPFDVDSLYGGLCPNIALASCGVPCKDGTFDEIHLFIERGGLSADGQNEVRKTIADFSAQTSTLYKISGIHFIDKLPLTSVGKVKRYLLKETAVSERSTEREVSAPQKTSGGDVETIVMNIVKSHADTQTVTLDSHLQYDLGFDSLTLMEICVDIEGELNTLIAENMGAVKTVRDVITLIERGGTVSRDVAYNIEDYPLPKMKKHMRRLKTLMRLSRLAWRFKVSGLENIPADGKYILCPNHQSYLDALWIWAAVGHKRVDLSKISCLAAEVFLSSKFMLAMLGGIPVERSGNTIPAMKRGLACIQDGYTMLIHPEGTRSRDGKMHDFKGGAAKLAIDADVPVIPVRIDGAWNIFPPHKKCPKVFRFGKRYPITISFGNPIAPNGKSVDGLTAEIQSAVENLQKK